MRIGSTFSFRERMVRTCLRKKGMSFFFRSSPGNPGPRREVLRSTLPSADGMDDPLHLLEPHLGVERPPGLDDHAGLRLAESVAAGDAQVDLIRQLPGQEFPLGDPDQVIGPAGLPAGSRRNDDGGDRRVLIRPQPVPESPGILRCCLIYGSWQLNPVSRLKSGPIVALLNHRARPAVFQFPIPNAQSAIRNWLFRISNSAFRIIRGLPR